MTTSGAAHRPRRLWTTIVRSAVLTLVTMYGVLVLATEAPRLLTLLVVAGVLALDGLLLVLAARRRARSLAVWCGVVAVLAAVGQAGWVYTVFAWDALPYFGDGFGWLACGMAVALMVTIGLLIRRASRPVGWAVLLGSVQGLVASSVLLLAAFAAAMGAD